MITFVLSGGGNLGALQIGAVQVLMEEGIYPEMLVGTSAGAVNAAFLACEPTLESVHKLERIWRGIKKSNIYPGGPLHRAWHLATHQDSLCTRKNFTDFLQRNTPERVQVFRDMKIPLYIVATDLLTGHRYVFGDDPDERVLDALLASTAVPPIFSPWTYRGKLLVDGGVSDNIPIDVAVEKGATEIYALDVLQERPADDGHWNIAEISRLSLIDLIAQQRNRDLSIYASYPDVNLHYLPLCASKALAFDDFSHATELIIHGRAVAGAYLSQIKSTKTTKKTLHPRRDAMQLLIRTRHFLTTLVSHFHFSGQH